MWMVAQVLIDGSILAGAGTLLAGIVGVGTWYLTKREQKRNAGSSLIEDALKLQKAAHAAYEEGLEELQAIREEMELVRTEIEGLRAELNHWRSVAEAARLAHQVATGQDPSWWKPFDPRTV